MELAVLGVPSSAGSYAAGQEQAPGALRAAGLVEALVTAGIDVVDLGDQQVQVWEPDRSSPRAQNVEAVVACLVELEARLRPVLSVGTRALVLGGNCTVALAVVAALQGISEENAGLLSFDRQYDLNTPASTSDGALDWMGLAHALNLPDVVPELAGAFGPAPLLRPEQIGWLGVEPELATAWERSWADHLGLHVTASSALAADPAGCTAAALDALPIGPLAVHLDVDVLDFTDAPLAENTDGRNTGPTLDQLADALRVATADPRFRALSIGELNPTRSAGDPAAIPRFVAALVAALS